MTDQKEDGGNGESQAVEKIDGTVVPMQKERPRENSRISIAGRPDINEISKRNEIAEKREKKSFYTVTGIIILFVVAVVVLIFFFG